MDLILWRHAEATEDGGGAGDLQRSLTSRGERQAERMASWLRRALPERARVLVSPARRTQQTAAKLGRRFETVEALAPGGSVQALLRVACWPEAHEPVLVVGHQPTLGLAAAFLLSGAAAPWAVRKGALVWLRSRERGGELQVVLHAALAPELV